MKHLNSSIAFLALLMAGILVSGCGTPEGDPMKGASTGPQPSSAGKLPEPKKQPDPSTVPSNPNSAFSR